MASHRRVRKEIRPEQAKMIAAEIERMSDEARVIQGDVKTAGNRLEESWIGRAKVNFFSRFGQTPGKINRLADQLSHDARKLWGLTLVIEVLEKIEDVFDGD